VQARLEAVAWMTQNPATGDRRAGFLDKGENTPHAAALIRQQAHEIDDLWDRLSRAYALVRNESPAEMIHDEMEQLRAMLDERRNHPCHSSALKNARKRQ
jgi:hypothetical protein